MTANPLRKQTLLGIAPSTTKADAPQASEPAAFTPAPEPPPPAAGTPLTTAGADNPLRKQTLLGIAPASAAPSSAAAVMSSPASGDDSAADALPPTHGLPPDAAPETGSQAAEGAAPTVASSQLESEAAAPSSKTDAPTTRDVAAAPITQSAQSTPVATSSDDPLPELRRPRARWLAVLGVAAALALGVVGLRSLDRAPTPAPVAERPAAAVGNRESAREPVATSATGAPAAELVAAPSAADPASAEGQPPTPSTPAEAASAPATGAAAPATSGAKVRINVDSAPPGARLFWKGKEVGTTPFVLELDPGERHAYELGLPGHVTRKVVIDGTQSDIKIGLRPDPKAPPGITSRK